MPEDDALAATATDGNASGSATESTVPAGPEPTTQPARRAIGETLGRYRIERELGSGGMGIVYAAFDPDLERRVALKVLRDDIAGAAEHRLLREARAMAKLTHPNVVAVYEVATVAGRDYVAMELVDGEPLVDWLRDHRQQPREILAAFVAAGHGLATAHEAGIVHRDFKPHNVLRSRTGRIVVTDFGLARASGDAAPMGAAVPPTASAPELTVPGSLLGTPAYMAPEQWRGERVTAASDQFAFCVALWEALAGERPFRGDTLDELRERVLAGPSGCDTSRLPSRIARVMVRGLALDPAQRWPSMRALLARLDARSRRVAVVVLGGATVAIGAVAAALLVSRPEPVGAPSCELPVLDPASVWPAEAERAIRAGNPIAADELARTMQQWTALRAQVCAPGHPKRSQHLACLDRVLLRTDALRRARLLDVKASAWGVMAQTIPPDACLRDDPPRMPERYSDAAVIGLALRSGAKLPDKTVANARAAMDSDACARAYLSFVDPAPRGPEVAASAAQLCGDDQAYAASLLNQIQRRPSEFVDPGLPEAIRAAQRVVEHAAQPMMARQFLMFQATEAARQGRLEAALGYLDRAFATGEPVELEVRRRLLRTWLLIERSRTADLAEARRDVAWMRAHATEELAPKNLLDGIDATTRWYAGEIAMAHPILVASIAHDGRSDPAAPPLHGSVVDERGAPVAGATVALGSDLVGDAAGVATPLYEMGGEPKALQLTTTDTAGRFAFDHGGGDDVIAQRADRRSKPAPAREGVRLVLAPTAIVRGVVRPRPERGRVVISARVPGRAYPVVAPVLADGTFELAGLPVGELVLRASRRELFHSGTGAPRTVRTGATPLVGIEVAPPSDRTVTVIVRGATAAPIDGAHVYILAGTPRVATVKDLRGVPPTVQLAVETARVLLDAPPADIAGRVHHGDVVAVVHDAPSGAVSVCAYGIHVDAGDPEFWAKYTRSEVRQPVKCQPLAAGETTAVVEVPPMNRLD